MSYFDYLFQNPDTVQEPIVPESVIEFCFNYNDTLKFTMEFLDLHKLVFISFVFGYLIKMLFTEIYRPGPPDVFLVNYNGKSLAIFGNLEKYHKKLRKLGGLYNEHLVYNNIRMPGWVFPIQKFNQANDFIKSV
jgi:hypothetical protein